MSVGRLEQRHALTHTITLRRGAKFIDVRIYVISSEYDSSFFSVILRASSIESLVINLDSGVSSEFLRKIRNRGTS